jgi:hypothetical protein
MRKILALVLFLIIFSLLPLSFFLPTVLAGSADIWAECGSSKYPIGSTKSMGGTTYYCCSGPKWQDTPCGSSGTTTTRPPSTTTTTLPACNNNSICEYTRSENQYNCPSDCYTTLEVYADLNRDGRIDLIPSEKVTPTTNLVPNQQVRINLTFSDSRYNSTQGFNLRLDATIDGNPWTNDNGCKICGNSLDQMGCSASMRGNRRSWDGSRQGYPIIVYMENGYAEIDFNATLPSTLSSGPHKITIKPVILGSLIPLRAAEVQFKVGDGFYTFIIIVKNIFNRLTGFFTYL